MWISLFLFLAVVVVVDMFFYFIGARLTTGATATIGDVTFSIEIADNPISQGRGLSGRKSLPDKKGMLFRFPYSGNHGFWMKDMEFPIDIIWIEGDLVMGVTSNVRPEVKKSFSELTIYYPPHIVDTVLEVNAGIAERYGIAKGMRVDITEKE